MEAPRPLYPQTGVPSTHLNRTGLDTVDYRPFAPPGIEFQAVQSVIWPLYRQTELNRACWYSSTHVTSLILRVLAGIYTLHLRAEFRFQTPRAEPASRRYDVTSDVRS
jgi:hypothetical protein